MFGIEKPEDVLTEDEKCLCAREMGVDIEKNANCDRCPHREGLKNSEKEGEEE